MPRLIVRDLLECINGLPRHVRWSIAEKHREAYARNVALELITFTYSHLPTLDGHTLRWYDEAPRLTWPSMYVMLRRKHQNALYRIYKTADDVYRVVQEYKGRTRAGRSFDKDPVWDMAVAGVATYTAVLVRPDGDTLKVVEARSKVLGGVSIRGTQDELYPFVRSAIERAKALC